MTDMVDPHVPLPGAVMSICDRLVGWLCESALPLWDEHGVDRFGGGFFETLARGAGGELIASGSVRRGRVVARQIYAFDVGNRIGWRSRFSSPVEHGCDYLLSHLHDGDALFHTALHAHTRQPADSFSLYEQAFYLFVLARMTRTAGGGEPYTGSESYREVAEKCLARLRSGWGRAGGGFDETVPASLPLRSNPHMHLLEAALAWLDVSEGAARQPWLALAGEVVGLCLTHFVDANTGAVREYFDGEWRPAGGDDGRIAEPGHQFEWAWLLLEWASTGEAGSTRQLCVDTALRLMEVGERWGVDHGRGVAINEIWMDMTVKDASAKVWPQTERIKAWCARLAFARSQPESELAARQIVKAADALWRYLDIEPRGLWHEVQSSDASFVPGVSKASSFYHVVCAIDVLRRTVAALEPSQPVAVS